LRRHIKSGRIDYLANFQAAGADDLLIGQLFEANEFNLA